jgi:dTDP-4-dehydrorhamnose 3,5-epimerase
MIKVKKTSLPEVLLIERYSAKDHRGFYAEVYNKKLYVDNGIKVKFVADDFSCSKYNVLRGLHGDTKTWKLISCPYGKLFLAVVNYNKKSKYFGKSETFILTPENRLQVLIPPLHVNGHYIMSRNGAIFHYKQSAYYAGAKNQYSVKWDDPRFKIKWPIKGKPILSKRDRG